jgi:MFS family permease
VGFFARPLGGIVFGHFGDRVGRKSMLLVTLLMMGVPTILIGLIPTYDKIGYWAAVLLVLLRIVQGLAVGGEWGGAVLMDLRRHSERGKCSSGQPVGRSGGPASPEAARTGEARSDDANRRSGRMEQLLGTWAAR